MQRGQRRSLFSRRSTSSTSFYTHSFPPSAEATQTRLSLPPSAKRSGSGGAVADDGKQKEKKMKMFESLMDKAGELSLRCSVLDVEGNWTAEEGRYKKSELCKEHDLDPRDLRKLDSLAPNLVPLILTRKSCILISILHIRALIKPDRVIVFDTAGTVESEVQRKFKWHLEKNIRTGLSTRCGDEVRDEDVELPYEHRALESILVATANALEEEMAYCRRIVQQLLADLEDDINRENLKKLLHYSRRVVGFQSRARYVKRAVDELLDSDEDLSAMYLTSRAQGKPRALHDHEQLELLLESFQKQVEEIVSEVDTTVANMQSTQEITELMLDSGRNALLALDIKVSIITLGVTSGALVAGFFGMNLLTRLESHPQAFFIVSGTAIGIAFLCSYVGLRILRRVRRVALNAGGRKYSQHLPLLSELADQAHIHSSIPHQQQPTWLGRIFSYRYPHFPRGLPQLAMRRMYFLGRLFRGRKPWTGHRSWPGMMKMGISSTASPPPGRLIWINEKADLARARDALRYQQIERGAGESEEGTDGQSRRKERDWERWQDDCWEQGGKWGKVKRWGRGRSGEM
ncbi:magnesium transporter [Tremella mesenterica]|uniref:Magnesium transporter n=2 Tax=Tremella mesenterica TaxID=5217 RepID=A0A4Q1B8R3_TREME|nr:magnesium transporter [Tremella mesenterica]